MEFSDLRPCFQPSNEREAKGRRRQTQRSIHEHDCLVQLIEIDMIWILYRLITSAYSHLLSVFYGNLSPARELRVIRALVNRFSREKIICRWARRAAKSARFEPFLSLRYVLMMSHNKNRLACSFSSFTAAKRLCKSSPAPKHPHYAVLHAFNVLQPNSYNCFAVLYSVEN